jgi:hypothetical protein
MTAFAQAWGYFNSGSWDALAGLLDQDVKLVRVKSQGLVSGHKEVMHYLRNNVGADGEEFFPIGTPTWNSTNTIVTGRAIWVDKDYNAGCTPSTPTSPPCGTISFYFRFTSASPGLIDRMWASPD